MLLVALPKPPCLKGAAEHYLGLCANQRGEFDEARRLFETVVEKGSPHYQSRALHSIGRTYYDQGSIDAACPFYIEAGRIADSDPATLANSQAMVAVVRSIHGDHKHAVAQLEELMPLFRLLARQYPSTYYDYLNSLAVELGEVGRVAEAQSVLSVALASPFAPAFPNWSETRDELEAKRTAATHSIVAVEHLPDVASPAETHTRRNHHRRVRTNIGPATARAFPVLPATRVLPPAMPDSATRATDGFDFSLTRFILERLDGSMQSRAPPLPR